MTCQKCMGMFEVKKVEKYTHLSKMYHTYKKSRVVCTQPWNQKRALTHKCSSQHWPKIYMKNTQMALSQLLITEFSCVTHQIICFWAFRFDWHHCQVNWISASWVKCKCTYFWRGTPKYANSFMPMCNVAEALTFLGNRNMWPMIDDIKSLAISKLGRWQH